MHSVRLTTKFQIGIPKALRDQMALKAGQEFVLVPKGNTLMLIPRRDIDDLRGMMSGANTEHVRERG